ncbi:MAG: deoxyribodipyrimidine photo-lyase [Melioribacteraceae bacterium]|nr:deoxyribodipyrimidine photo-lyase [Melioribacteraceae bacterium]
MEVDKKRVNEIKSGAIKTGPILYWMQRDQRVDDNWALLFAQEKAIEKNEKLIIVFNLVNEFLDATERQFYFMFEGLKEVEKDLEKLNIKFELLIGDCSKTVPKFIEDNDVSILITDFNPLRLTKIWKKKVADLIKIPFYEVDTHNIVPIWQASNKLEYAAYTIRPKITKQLDKFLTEIRNVKKFSGEKVQNVTDWNKVFLDLKINRNVKPVKNFVGGSDNAISVLNEFVNKKLKHYSELRNNPTLNYISNISPYLHFGQISSQRVALVVQQFIEYDESIKSFLEELIVRKELADNYCFNNNSYDSFEGFHDWAKKSLKEHRNDEREFIYKLNDFESMNTHDPLWNAAQYEVYSTGKMHGFMRMYWAKKILEWSESPEEAQKTAIYLNDKYQLDGRDPNGYAGIAWSIGGVHDRAWGERAVFGKIRFMNFNGCKRKFDVNNYIKLYTVNN